MAHARLTLMPGVDQNKTEALNEAAISTSQLIRFMPDRNGNALPQKIGGWVKHYAQAMTSDVKALWAWADANSDNHLAVGMTGGLAVIADDMLSDRSPSFYEYSTTVDFSTTAGSAEVDIIDVGSNVNDSGSVFIMTPVSVGGLIMFGLYSTIAQSADQYSVDSTNVIGVPLPAPSTVANGGAVPTFDTTAGDPVITVTLADHGLPRGGNFAILVPVTVGGITIPVGNYTVQTVPSTSTFTIFTEDTPTSTDTQDMNGGDVLFRYYIGRPQQETSGGYGTGGYGRGGYGAGVTTGTGREFDTTSGTGVGTVATVLLTPTGFSIPIGSRITVSGVTPAEYNGNFTVSNTAASSIAYDAGATITGPITVQGVVSVNTWPFADVDDWTLDNWGSELISCPQNGAIYRWSAIDGGANSIIVPNAPTNNEGTLVAMPQRQIIAYGSTFNDIQDPLLVRWCDINDYDDWVANATNQAGSFRLATGSKIKFALQAMGQILLWTDVGLWSMQYVSLPAVYAFNELARGCGLIGRKSAAQASGGLFWMSQSQFFRLSGEGVQAMVCPVWDVIFQDIDLDYADNIRAAPNSRFNEVMWFYPTTGSGGVPTKYVKYNLLTDQWDYGTLTRAAWIDQSVYGAPIAAGADRFIYQHEVGYDADGAAISASFKTGYFALADGDQLAFIDQFWPDMKWAPYGDSGSGTVYITFHVTEYAGATPRVYGPYAVTRGTEYITPRFRARLIAIEVSSSDIGSFWRLGNCRYRIQPDGRFL